MRLESVLTPARFVVSFSSVKRLGMSTASSVGVSSRLIFSPALSFARSSSLVCLRGSVDSRLGGSVADVGLGRLQGCLVSCSDSRASFARVRVPSAKLSLATCDGVFYHCDMALCRDLVRFRCLLFVVMCLCLYKAEEPTFVQRGGNTACLFVVQAGYYRRFLQTGQLLGECHAKTTTKQQKK